MANVVLILGNGFDVDLGLKSKYSDFIFGNKWNQLYDYVDEKYKDKMKMFSLLTHIHNAGHTPSLWFDVEYEIYKYINKYTFKEKDQLDLLGRTAQSEFIRLREALYYHLLGATREFVLDKNKWSYILLKALIESQNKLDVYNFNYTNSCALCQLPQIDIKYIHGSLDDNDIVLGCERIGHEYIPLQFSFFLKSNMINRPNNIIEKLYNANEVIFFGHSLNKFDFHYFKEFFEYICYPIDHELHLTFITKDEKSELDIRNNLHAQGIPVPYLFKSNIETTLIHSAPNDSAKAKEQDKFDTLLKRISRDHLIT